MTRKTNPRIQGLWFGGMVIACWLALMTCCPLATAQEQISATGDETAALWTEGLQWGPYLTGTTSSGTEVNVRTTAPTNVVVYYTTEEFYRRYGAYNLKATDGLRNDAHRILLTDLKADTRYYYQAACDDCNSAKYHFKTFPLFGTFTFAVYGDTQDEVPNFTQSERHRLVAARIAQEEDLLFVINTGDLVNDGDDVANWNRYFEATRRMGACAAVFPAHGNHDDETWYYENFGIAPNYSFDCGNIHFTILDYLDPESQTEWLKKDMETRQEWKIAVSHYPLYTSEPNHFGGYENLKNSWEPIFREKGVNLVFQGHVHAYERYVQSGIMYMVVGIGGGPYDLLEQDKYPGWQSSLERSLGYARITVDPLEGTLKVEVVRVADISPDGQEVVLLPEESVYDSFSMHSAMVAENQAIWAKKLKKVLYEMVINLQILIRGV